MNNFKRICAAASALVMTAGMTACGGADDGSDATVTTTTGITVEINTATLAEEDSATLDDVADLLPDVELENKTIKWFSFYDPFHATTSGNTKSLNLELFERKYGGEIEYIATTWNNRLNDLSTKLLGGEGIDFIPGGDLDSFPKGVPNGQFEAYDQYVDFSSELWAPVKDLNDMFELNGKHYLIATQATSGAVVVYNKATIEEYGLPDPAELVESNKWTLSAFKDMLSQYVSPDNERYGLDGWFNEKPLMLTCGVTPVELKDGKLVSNLYDERLERSMNFMYDLNQSGLILDKSLTDWQEKPAYIGEGKELFYIGGMYVIESAPEIWTATFGNAEDVMIAPVPRDENADNYYLNAGLDAYMLCKGAQNPEGVARFMECTLAANMDPGALEIAEKKLRDDYGWSDEMIEMRHKIDAMTAEHPMYSIHTGCPTDMYDILDSGEYGIRASFYGHEWATVREALVETIELLADEFNASLENV